MAQDYSPLVKLVLGKLAAEPEAVRNRLLATIPQSALSLVVTSITILLICITTVLIRPTLWTWVWLAISAGIVAWRILYPELRRRLGHGTPLVGIMITSALLFITFGVGCAGSIASGDGALTAMSVAAVMGMVAGLATRWAAVPRAAVFTMALTALPRSHAGPSGWPQRWPPCVASVVMSVAATVQNHENLLAAVVGEEAASAGTHRPPDRPAQPHRARRAPEGGLRSTATTRRRAVGFASVPGPGRFKSINDAHGHATGMSFCGASPAASGRHQPRCHRGAHRRR
jgi:hypothetical protein